MTTIKPHPPRHRPSFRPNTIKDRVLGILRESDIPLLTREIVELIPVKYGVTISRESVVPQLSRLCREGWVSYSRYVWGYLPAASGGQMSGDSES